jgi:hypothetical protein
VGAPVCLPRESRRSMLVRAAGRWAQALLSASVALITDGNRSFAALGLPRMISCTVYEHPSLRLSHAVNCRVSGLSSSIQSLCHLPLHRSSSAPPCPLCSHCSNTLIGEMAHGADLGKRPHDESSSPPPPRQMPTVPGDHWVNAVRR